MIIRNYLFHRVSTEKDRFWPPMNPALFEKIIRLLTERHKMVSLEEWLQTGGKNFRGKKAATVLFDDGYKDNIEYAAPILKKFNCPASFYIATDCINRNIPTWTYLLDHTLQQTRLSTISIDHSQAPEEIKNLTLSAKSMTGKIKPWMKRLPNSDRVMVLNNILDQCKDVPLPQNKMMNWEDIRQLMHAGFNIGSHSHTHPVLAALEDEEDISDELNLSAVAIKEKLGQMPLIISYPIGSYDERVTRLAQQVGYRYGLAVDERFFKSNKDDIMSIPRVEIHQEPWWKVNLRLKGLYQKARHLWK